MTVVTETWMPVSGRFKEYPLQPEVQMWDYGIGVVSKGHHAPEALLSAAVEEWAQESYDDLTLYENNGWTRMEGPVLPPLWMRRLEDVRHEWWATRVWGGGEYRYYVNPVAPWERGAYPVTVVDCV